MDLYEELKSDLDEIHSDVGKMWKSSLGDEIILLIMTSVSTLLFVTLSILNFCDGGWDIVLGVYYMILTVLMVKLCVRTVLGMKNVREHLRANDLWYESELNRLNNMKEEEMENGDRN